MIQIRDTVEGDYQAIVALNQAVVEKTSPMDKERLGQLHRMSDFCKVAVHNQNMAAFIIVLKAGAPYESINYEWFAKRYSSFLYVDRVVVGSEFFGMKIGSALYQALFDYAQAQATEVVTCEYNIEPPNPESAAFHQKFGFQELGTQTIAAETKRVSMQVAQIE